MRNPSRRKSPIPFLLLLCTFLPSKLVAQSSAAGTRKTRTSHLPSSPHQYDPATFEPLRAPGFGGVSSPAFFSDGGRLAISGNSVVFLLDAGTYEIERQLFGHPGGITSVKWSKDGQFLASGSIDTLVKLWDAKTGELVRTLEGHPGYVESLDWSPDGSQLVSAGYGMTA